MTNHIAGIAAAVDDLLKQLIKILQNDHLNRFMPSVKEILVKSHHVLICFTFEELQLVVEVLDAFEVHSVVKGLDHFEDNVSGAFQQADLFGEINASHVLRRQQNSLAKFFDR